MKILSFGEILFDVFGDESKIGGAPFNFAAHAVRAGADTYLISAVGRDALGEVALREVGNYSVSTKYISICEKYATGTCNVTLDSQGIPHYDLVCPAAYDDIAFDENIAKEKFDGLYFGTLALRKDNNIKTLQKIIAIGNYKEIFVDVNVRQPFCRQKSLLFALENATVVKISDEELPFVMNEVFQIQRKDLRQAALLIAERYTNIKLLLITCGSKGSIAYDTRTKEFFTCDAQKTKVVSTVGAGDSFAATFFVDHINQKPILECMQRASKVSAYVVSQMEAIPKL